VSYNTVISRIQKYFCTSIDSSAKPSPDDNATKVAKELTQPDDSARKVTKELIEPDNSTTKDTKELIQPDDSTRQVTKELATSSSDSFTAATSTYSENVNEKQQQQQQQPAGDNYFHSSGDDQALPVTASELLLLASADNTEVSSSSCSDVNRVTGSKESYPKAPSIPDQHVTVDVDSTVPVATSGPIDNQSVKSEVNVTVASVDAKDDKMKSENDLHKETVSLSPVPVVPADITTQSDEISSTAEHVIVSKETTADKPAAAAELVNDIYKQPSEMLLTTEVLASNSTVEQSDLLQEFEDRVKEKQTEQISDGNNIEKQKLEDENVEKKDDNVESILPTADTIPTVLDGNQASSDPQSHDKNYEEELQYLKSVSLTCMYK